MDVDLFKALVVHDRKSVVDQFIPLYKRMLLERMRELQIQEASILSHMTQWGHQESELVHSKLVLLKLLEMNKMKVHESDLHSKIRLLYENECFSFSISQAEMRNINKFSTMMKMKSNELVIMIRVQKESYGTSYVQMVIEYVNPHRLKQGIDEYALTRCGLLDSNQREYFGIPPDCTWSFPLRLKDFISPTSDYFGLVTKISSTHALLQMFQVPYGYSKFLIVRPTVLESPTLNDSV